MQNKYTDLSGKVFNKLTVIKLHKHQTNGKRRWWCKCTCGKKTSVLDYNLKNGAVKSCGCLRHIGHTFTHKMTGTTEYRIWNLMVMRCHNKNHPAYKWYGARGIKVCKKWCTFTGFFKDMGNRPSKHLSLDRIDNSKGYFKKNCRWATHKQQARNARSNRNITYNGVTKCLAAWAEQYNLHQSCISRRIDRGWSFIEAVTTPPRVLKVNQK